MIDRLRKKFILVSALAAVAVFSAIYLGIYAFSTEGLNRMMDTLTEMIAENGGSFPQWKESPPPHPPGQRPGRGMITPETRFSTRFFSVWADDQGCVTGENIIFISSVTRAQAAEYGESAMRRGKERGWMGNFRYRIRRMPEGSLIVFVDGAMNRRMTGEIMLTAFLVLSVSGIALLFLIVLFSKRAVGPAALSYEKQKQFVTDAGHELKTPLTLILSNLDILEEEIGQNEWLEDMRSEGERMGALIRELVMLSRMDEEETKPTVSQFDLSGALADVVSEFAPLAEKCGKKLSTFLRPGLLYEGDEEMICRLMAILLDNALKYCDAGGEIRVSLCKKRHPVIRVENTYRKVGQAQLGRMFDRFYRGDPARAHTGSFGIGLSIARAIARKHRGDILAYRAGREEIGFKVILR